MSSKLTPASSESLLNQRKRPWVSRVYAELLLEHRVVGVEELLHEQVEELFLHAALVHAFLAHELDLHLFLVVLALRGERSERVVEDVAATDLDAQDRAVVEQPEGHLEAALVDDVRDDALHREPALELDRVDLGCGREEPGVLQEDELVSGVCLLLLLRVVVVSGERLDVQLFGAGVVHEDRGVDASVARVALDQQVQQLDLQLEPLLRLADLFVRVELHDRNRDVVLELLVQPQQSVCVQRVQVLRLVRPGLPSESPGLGRARAACGRSRATRGFP